MIDEQRFRARLAALGEARHLIGERSTVYDTDIPDAFLQPLLIVADRLEAWLLRPADGALCVLESHVRETVAERLGYTMCDTVWRPAAGGRHQCHGVIDHNGDHWCSCGERAPR